MIEFEILARGLFRPNQLTITYNPTLTMPTTGTAPDPALTTPATGPTPAPTLTTPTTGTAPDPALTTPDISPNPAPTQTPPAIGINHVGAQFIAPSPNDTTPQATTTNSPSHTTPTIQQWMDTLWQQKLTLAQQKNIPLYNTPLFRLIHAHVRPGAQHVHGRGDPRGCPPAADRPVATSANSHTPSAPHLPPTGDAIEPVGAGDGTCEEGTLGSPRGGAAPQLHLTLGNTTYKEYVTTREPAFAHNRPREELSNALSVCSVVETTDRYILLDKRQGVDVYAGRYHVIGGFFERNLDTTETTETIETIETIETSATSATSATNPDPFAAIRREIREETGIQTADIAEQYCLGVLYDLATPHAELCFLTRLNIPLNEVHQRVPEENEIKQLLSLYVTADSLRNFILTNHGNISATGEPNLLLYGALNFGEAWLEEIMAKL